MYTIGAVILSVLLIVIITLTYLAPVQAATYFVLGVIVFLAGVIDICKAIERDRNNYF